MDNLSKFNRLSIILLILTLLSLGGSGYLPAILYFFVPQSKIVFLLLMSILLIISFYQIHTRKERGILFNVIALINVLFVIFIYFPGNINWLNQTFGGHQEIAANVGWGVLAVCVVVFLVHLLYKKISK